LPFANALSTSNRQTRSIHRSVQYTS
jgi:hypothetical protein